MVPLVVLLIGFLVTTFSLTGYAAEQKAGWQAEWERVLQAAKQEGKVVIYGAPGADWRKALVEGFQKAYPGISVEYMGGPAHETWPRVMAERKAEKYVFDLLIGGTTGPVTFMKDAQIFDPLPPALILPEVRDKSLWFQGRLWYADAEEKFVLPFEASVSTIIAVNPKLVTVHEFKSHWDLLNPKWRGKMVSSDIRGPGPGGGASRFLYSHKNLGPGFLQRLFGEMSITLAVDRRQMMDWLAQGKYAVALFPSGSDVVQAQELGLPVAPVPAENLKEGGPFSSGFGNVSLMNRAPHPNAARLYINWLLAREAQANFQRIVKNPSLRIDVPREGIPDFMVPKKAGEYFFSSHESAARIGAKEIQKIVTEAVEGKKQ